MASTSPAPTVNDALLIRELDTLQELSRDHRDAYLGATHFQNVRDMYNLAPPTVAAPTFRPYVNIPQFQALMLMEASDLADSDPKIYITGPGGKQDAQRQEAFMGQWHRGQFSLQALYSSLWSLLGGTGFLQVGYDPLARRGVGETYLRWLDPANCFPDPAATNEEDWYYFQVEARLWPDEIRRRFPRAYPTGIAQAVANSGTLSSDHQWGAGKLKMPPGPMSAIGNQPSERGLGPSDGRRTVRYTFIYDSNVREIALNGAGNSTSTSNIIPAKFELLYPNGRYIVDCDGVVLFDGDNPHPMSQFPISRILSLPALTSFWCPPPSRYTLDLQDLASRMLRQVFENFVRTNNAVWVLDGASGLTRENFSGLPGEMCVIDASGKKPELVTPQAFPTQFLSYPQYLLGLQKELQGFGPAREGKTGSGNVGTDLFDSSVMQSQSITRLRGKLLATGIQRVAEQVFYCMAKYQGKGHYPTFETGFKLTDWSPIEPSKLGDYEVFLDPASIRPISASALRKIVPELRKLQMIDTKTGLEMMDIPGAAEIATGIGAEKSLEALARLKKR